MDVNNLPKVVILLPDSAVAESCASVMH